MNIFQQLGISSVHSLLFLLVAVSYALKLFVGQEFSLPKYYSELLQVPIDLVFIGLSIIVAQVTSSPEKIIIRTDDLLGWLFIFFIGLIVVAALWRNSLKLFDNNKWIKTTLVLLANMFIALKFLQHAFVIIKGVN